MPIWRINPNEYCFDVVVSSLGQRHPTAHYMEHAMYWADLMAVEYDWANSGIDDDLFNDDGTFLWKWFPTATEFVPVFHDDIELSGEQYTLTNTMTMVDAFWQQWVSVYEFINIMTHFRTAITFNFTDPLYPVSINDDNAPVGTRGANELNVNHVVWGYEDTTEMVKYGKLRKRDFMDHMPRASPLEIGVSAGAPCGWSASVNVNLFVNSWLYDPDTAVYSTNHTLISHDCHATNADHPDHTEDDPDFDPATDLPCFSSWWRHWNPEGVEYFTNNHFWFDNGNPPQQQIECVLRNFPETTMQEDWDRLLTLHNAAWATADYDAGLGIPSLYTSNSYWTVEAYSGYKGPPGGFSEPTPTHGIAMSQFEAVGGWAFPILNGEGQGVNIQHLYGVLEWYIRAYYHNQLFGQLGREPFPEQYITNPLLHRTFAYTGGLSIEAAYLTIDNPNDLTGAAFRSAFLSAQRVTLASINIPRVFTYDGYTTNQQFGNPLSTFFYEADISDIIDFPHDPAATVLAICGIPSPAGAIDPTPPGDWSDFNIGGKPVGTCVTSSGTVHSSHHALIARGTRYSVSSVPQSPLELQNQFGDYYEPWFIEDSETGQKRTTRIGNEFYSIE